MAIRKRINRNMSPSMNRKQDLLLSILRIVVSLLFIFSGFVKGIDPLGSTYKLNDYFEAFGGFFQHVSILSLPFAIVLSTLELVIGLNLLFKIRLKWTLVVALIFMVIMTALTLYIAINNPVSDCGCFGDAIVISNWATFSKNIVISLIIIVSLVLIGRARPLFAPRVEWIALSVFVFSGFALSIYSYRNLPLIDFLPYKVGVNISEAMLIPEGASVDEYETTFIYSKEGVQKEFTLENYPKGDTSWVFVDQKSVLIKEGAKAAIHDFTIVNAQYEDITDDVLSYQGESYLLIAYDLAKVSQDAAIQTEIAYQKTLAKGAKFYALTASTNDVVQRFIQLNKVTFPFHSTDPITLKTIVRANPGMILIENGIIKGKWNWRDFDTILF
jgi:uncharacterized membrane protein YphA (DoxX/SURF4 family)